MGQAHADVSPPIHEPEDWQPAGLGQHPTNSAATITRSPNAAGLTSPGQRPTKTLQTALVQTPSPKGASFISPGQRPESRTIHTVPSPNGARFISPGQRPGNPTTHTSTRPEGATPGWGHAQARDLEQPVARSVADILSAYDELMENSQRRIRVLEAMACALYREWFVHLRFPGHEKLPRVATPLGDIPQGWEGRFGDLATIERDGIHPFAFPDQDFEHFSIPGLDNGRQPAIELGATIHSGKYCIDDSTVLLSKLNPRIPRIWLPVPSRQRRAITSTEFLGLKPQPGVTREFIYAKCCSEEFAGQFGSLAIGTSTSHQRVKPENLLAMPSTVPDRKPIVRFTKLVSPMLKVSQQLRLQIQNLRRTRDLLLPRLLSGQVALNSKEL